MPKKKGKGRKKGKKGDQVLSAPYKFSADAGDGICPLDPQEPPLSWGYIDDRYDKVQVNKNVISGKALKTEAPGEEPPPWVSGTNVLPLNPRTYRFRYTIKNIDKSANKTYFDDILVGFAARDKMNDADVRQRFGFYYYKAWGGKHDNRRIFNHYVSVGSGKKLGKNAYIFFDPRLYNFSELVNEDCIDVFINMKTGKFWFELVYTDNTQKSFGSRDFVIAPEHLKQLTPIAAVRGVDSSIELTSVCKLVDDKYTLHRPIELLSMESLHRLKYLAPAEWGLHHPSYKDNIIGGTIKSGCEGYNWATGTATLPEQGKYRIQYSVDSIQSGYVADIIVGVAYRRALVMSEDSYSPNGFYCWASYRGGNGSSLLADGNPAQTGIQQESRAGSIIEVIVDQDASTVEFHIDGQPVGTALQLAAERNLAPVACVVRPDSALTLVAVERVKPPGGDRWKAAAELEKAYAAERDRAALGLFPWAAWGSSHPSYTGKISGGAITTGNGNSEFWATGAGTLPEQGKYRIEYRVDGVDIGPFHDIYVGVASRAARVENQGGAELDGCYCWVSRNPGHGSMLIANGIRVQRGIPLESSAGSTIEIIVDQDASTVEFLLDGAPLQGGNMGGSHKLTVNPLHKRDLTPVACVMYSGSALTLVKVEKLRAELDYGYDNDADSSGEEATLDLLPRLPHLFIRSSLRF